jgi:uncharacterized protein YdbL (DUF1318 family)
MTRVRTPPTFTPAWLVALALLAGCVAVTINVTFPQEKIDSAASSIEDLVRAPREAPADPPRPAPRSDGRAPAASISARWPTWLDPARAEAQVPELKTRTPEVIAVIESRRARYPEIEAALAKGCLGENNRGLLEARPGSACLPNVGALAEAENRDRMVLYRTLVEQNNMPPADFVRVQAAFARAHRERAPAGAWVQDEAGRWSRK